MTLAPLAFPKELAGAAEALTSALREVGVPAEWPSDQPAFLSAEQPQRIALPLIEALHRDLVNARIAYLFREEMAKHGSVRLGAATKVGSKVNFLTDFDFTLDFNWTYWRQLTPMQRIALVDHELTHCARGPEGEGWAILGHDVEEFSSIVRRWGLWKPDLVTFNAAIKAGAQLPLPFEAARPNA